MEQFSPYHFVEIPICKVPLQNVQNKLAQKISRLFAIGKSPKNKIGDLPLKKLSVSAT